MQYLNRPQKQDSPPPAMSYQGGNLPKEIYKHECVPFAIGSTFTAALATLDLITDWLAWRTFSTFDFKGLVEESLSGNETKDSFWSLDNLYLNLPIIYLAICIASSIIYLLEITRLVSSFALQRQKVKESLDGVPYKGNTFVRYGGEVTLLLQTLVQDLALSLVLLATQAAISCTFVIPINSAIFVLAASTTCASLCWKFFQVTWRAGCLGRREEYHRGACLGILRLMSLFLILGSIGVTSLNLVLLTSPGKRPSQPSNPLLDKIGIDHWLEDDHLALVVSPDGGSHSFLPPLENGGTGSNPIHQSEEFYLQYSNIIRLKHIIGTSADLHNQTFIKSCDDIQNFTEPFLFSEHQNGYLGNDQWQCSIAFRFSYSVVQRSLNYNFMYKFQNKVNSDMCISSSFKPVVSAEEFFRSFHHEKRASATDSLETTNSVTSSDFPTVSSSPLETHTDQSHSDPKQLKLLMALSPVQCSHWIKCALKVEFDATNLMLSPCDLNFASEISLL